MGRFQVCVDACPGKKPGCNFNLLIYIRYRSINWGDMSSNGQAIINISQNFRKLYVRTVHFAWKSTTCFLHFDACGTENCWDKTLFLSICPQLNATCNVFSGITWSAEAHVKSLECCCKLTPRKACGYKMLIIMFVGGFWKNTLGYLDF